MNLGFTDTAMLSSYIGEIKNLQLKEACRVLESDLDYARWPAAIGHHHNYPGGLLTHTIEVMDFALKASEPLRGTVDYDVLIAAVLWHDYAKILEYEETNSFIEGSSLPTGEIRWDDPMYWTKAPYLGKIGHVCGSAIEFVSRATNLSVPQGIVDAVTHAILAHHGRRDWGSSVEPQTLEACLLHHADLLSAKFGPTKQKHE